MSIKIVTWIGISMQACSLNNNCFFPFRHRTGVRGKIQCSQSTADALMRSGKDHWLAEREDLVSAKGKGIMRTFCKFRVCGKAVCLSRSPSNLIRFLSSRRAPGLTPSVDRAHTANSKDTDEEDDVLVIDFAGKLASQLLKREREVEWVSELIHDSVREIVAQRATRKGKIAKSLDALPSHRSKNRVPIDEVVDVIKMPNFDSKKSADNIPSYAVKVPENVSRLIREYVSIVSLFDQLAHRPFTVVHTSDHCMVLSLSLSLSLSHSLSDCSGV